MVRNLPVGAEFQPNGFVHFRVWAPRPKKVSLVLENYPDTSQSSEVVMTAETHGYYTCLVKAAPGAHYRFKLDDEGLFPDPASRFQPEGPHGPSQIVDPHFAWTDTQWRGVTRQPVIYEMHIGTFTAEGTYRAAAEELPALAELGITMIELMPLAEFNGEFGWGYDGVGYFAPFHHYGTPGDLRLFVDRAHALGIAVILDVVYNHCGANGCYLHQFSPDYFTKKYICEWGDALNFDGDNSGPVREFFLANIRYWLEEFHLDGFRLDATQQIFDASSVHILFEITQAVRTAAKHKVTYVVAENEPQHVRLVKPTEKGGFGMDALWNDDFHHTANVAMKGHSEAYFSDYTGSPQELISAVKRGFLYQGQWYSWQQQPRGTPSLNLAPSCFVHFLQNHDQVANSGFGRRLHQLTHPGLYRAMTTLLLLGPATPMLFQGQEFAASTPFQYFADHHPELALLVRKGRTAFLHQFPSLAAPEVQPLLPCPDSSITFSRCKLDLRERDHHQQAYALHKDLLRLRHEDPVFSGAQSQGLDGAVLGPNALVLRFFATDDQDDRLLLLNMDRDLSLSPVPEPLLAPPEGRAWDLLWSSEHPDYGGGGVHPLYTDHRWNLPGMAAMVLIPTTQ